MMQREIRPNGEELNLALTDELVAIHRRHLGREPTSASTFHCENVVVTLMNEVLTKAETVLIANGNWENVRLTRELFREVMATELRAAVERATGRSVVAFIGANHTRPDIEAKVFVLDAPL
jgi:uncharacterized protein YbcI